MGALLHVVGSAVLCWLTRTPNERISLMQLDITQHRILTLLAATPDGLRPATVLGALLEEANPTNRVTTRGVSDAQRRLLNLGLTESTQGRWVRITDAGREALSQPAPPPAFDITKPVEHPGPAALHREAGTLKMGMNEKGESYSWQLWDHRGARHGVVIGSVGAGKTNLLVGVAHALTDQVNIDVVIIDLALGFGGYDMSDQDLAQTEVEASDLLKRMQLLVEERTEQLRDSGRQPWTGPTDEMPLKVVIVADAEDVFLNNADAVDVIARMGRKVGIVLIVAAFEATLRTMLSSTVRDHLFGSNALVLRTSFPTAPTAGVPSFNKALAIPRRFESGADTGGLGYDIEGEKVRAFFVTER